MQSWNSAGEAASPAGAPPAAAWGSFASGRERQARRGRPEAARVTVISRLQVGYLGYAGATADTKTSGATADTKKFQRAPPPTGCASWHATITRPAIMMVPRMIDAARRRDMGHGATDEKF